MLVLSSVLSMCHVDQVEIHFGQQVELDFREEHRTSNVYSLRDVIEAEKRKNFELKKRIGLRKTKIDLPQHWKTLSY